MQRWKQIRPYKTLIKSWTFDYCVKLRSGFLCWTVWPFWKTSGGCLTQILKRWLTIILSHNNCTQRYSQKFSNLNWEKVARRHLLKSQKCWNCKGLLGIIATTITKLNSLLVLHYWSSLCRRLLKLLIKWAQFINNYQKFTLGGSMTKQFFLKSCFVMK